MPTYKFTYTQQITISLKEYKRVDKLIKSGHRILIIKDTDGNNHLIDWQYVKHNDVKEIVVDRPDSLPEQNN